MIGNRIYAVVAGTVQVAKGKIVQPPGRQIAQVAHVVSKLRFSMQNEDSRFKPITTIVLQARDSNELAHVQMLLLKNKHKVSAFFDTNEPVYGFELVMTAIAVYTSKEKTVGILDYLPLWGS